MMKYILMQRKNNHLVGYMLFSCLDLFALFALFSLFSIRYFFSSLLSPFLSLLLFQRSFKSLNKEEWGRMGQNGMGKKKKFG